MGTVEQAAIGKVTRRLLPFLMLCFFIAFVDQVNISVAALQMNEDLGLSEAAFGLGAGILVWLLSLIYFAIVMSFYGVTFWLPHIVQDFSGAGDFVVSLLSAIPWVAAGISIFLVARHSDRMGERRWHVAVPCFVGAVGLVLSASLGQPLPALLALAITAAGIQPGVPTFWGLPTAFLSGTAAVAAIALINSLGNIGGFTGPYLAGLINESTGSNSGALFMLALVLASAGLLVLLARQKRSPGELQPKVWSVPCARTLERRFGYAVDHGT